MQQRVGAEPDGPATPPDPAVVQAFAARQQPEPARPDRSAGTRALVRYAIASSVHRLAAHDPVVRVGEDPEGVHQARVATRRLRSDLRTFGSLLDRDWTDHLRGELRWIGELLGRVRDTDVMIDRLTDRAGTMSDADRPAVTHLLDRLRADRSRRRAELLDAMISPRYLALVDDLATAGRDPQFVTERPDRPARREARRLARRPWRKLSRTVRALPDRPSDEELHAVRKRAKKARYALEAADPVAPRAMRRLARRVSTLQDVLGEQHDAVVTGVWLRDAARTTPDTAVAFAAGELAGSFARDAARRRRRWRREWKRARRRAAEVF